MSKTRPIPIYSLGRPYWYRYMMARLLPIAVLVLVLVGLLFLLITWLRMNAAAWLGVFGLLWSAAIVAVGSARR